MSKYRNMLGVSVAVLALMYAQSALATGDVGILPPDIDIQKFCIDQGVTKEEELEWLSDKPETSGLTGSQLLRSAQLYYSGDGQTLPDLTARVIL